MATPSANEQPSRGGRGPSVSGWPGGGTAVEASGSSKNLSSSSVGANTAGVGDSGSGSAGSGLQGASVPRWMGKRVGRFRLLALLGQGAMGRVFRAEDTLMARHVALKVLPRAIKKGGVRVGPEMLIREARAAAAIEHPNAVSVYEVNQAGDVCYVAMELLEGGNLRDLVRAAGPMDLTRACLVCAEAAEALAAAHAAGVVHRDVKPANLMLSRSGRCKVVDFGLARLDEAGRGGEWAANASAENVGTPQFIAPEILSGTPASPASDLYSLGGTLFYLLTGRAPYDARNSREMVRMHLEAPIPDLRAVRPDVSRPLADAVSRALAKRPGERWGSMEQFARVLRVHAIPTGPSESAGGNLALPTPGYLPAGSSSAPAGDNAARPARPSDPFQPPLPEAELSGPGEDRKTPNRSQLVLPMWAWLACGGTLVGAAALILCIAVSKTPSRDVSTSAGQQTSEAPTQAASVQRPAAVPVQPTPVSSQTLAPAQPKSVPPSAAPVAAILPHVPGPSLQLGDFAGESDLGDVKVPGLVNFDAPRHNYTVTGDGFDFYGKTDSGHLVWRQMSGDLTIKAGVRFVGSSPARFRKAALIVRQSLDPASPFADILMHGEGTIVVQDRLSAGQSAEQHMTDLAGSTLWLVRRGDHFTGYVSSGSEPQPVFEVTLPMKDPVYVGLAVSARDGRDRPGTKPETAVFSGVEIDPVARLNARPTP